MGHRLVDGVSTYSPDDDDVTIYLPRSATLADIIDTVKAKWGTDVDLNAIEVAAEHIQLTSLSYDTYDYSDYADYLVITR